MNLRPSVLVLDDDPQFFSALKVAFGEEFDLHPAKSADEVFAALERYPIECLLLDYDLGAETGHEVLDKIRKVRSGLPVIVVSGKVSLDMAIGFLNRQISAFVEKPPVLSELREKIRESLPERDAAASRLGLEVDAAKRCVRAGGAEVSLTPIEYKILCAFLKKPRERVSREEITQQVWGDAQLSRNTLDTHLGNLRRKVPSFGTKLKAVYGEGFCLEV